MIDSPQEELDAVNAATSLEADNDIRGYFLRVSEGGISVPDFVKRLDENDILVAIDGNLYLDGKKNLQSVFIPAGGLEDQEPKWLLTLCRAGVMFDILVERPLSSVFVVTTQEETDTIKQLFTMHKFDEFQDYENYEIYKSKTRMCDIVSFRKDPLALIFPVLWLMKNQLYPPLSAVLLVYLFSFFLNIYLFFIMFLVISFYVDRAQENLLRSFTMYADKFHYMTIAATNEADVGAILKSVDPRNKIRFEKPKAKTQRATVKKTMKKPAQP